jgi:hypothetical protein
MFFSFGNSSPYVFDGAMALKVKPVATFLWIQVLYMFEFANISLLI